MKKNLPTGGMLLSAVMVMVIFCACQKDQSPVSQETAATSSEEAHIVGVSGSLGEGITPSYAGSLASNYNKKYNEEGSQAQYVVFDAAVLSKFIANLQSKYGATKIFVNFGVYGKGASAPNSKDDGRLTVFFTGDKIPAPSSRRGNDAAATTDEFLNHGNIYP
jgi:hypothetical protein